MFNKLVEAHHRRLRRYLSKQEYIELVLLFYTIPQLNAIILLVDAYFLSSNFHGLFVKDICTSYAIGYGIPFSKIFTFQ